MTNNNTFEYDIFLNYAVEDIEHARSLKNALEKTGLKVWFDRDSLNAGDNWKKIIRKEIKASKHFLMLLSNNSILKSGYVKDEIEIALEILKEERLYEKYLIPIKIEDCEPESYVLRNIHSVNLYPSFENGVQKLLRIYINSDDLIRENIKIVGFDLGHGESSVSVTNLLSRDTPDSLELLNGRKSIITAVGIGDNKVLIGDDAFLSNKIDAFHIMFKSFEFEYEGFITPMKFFVSELFNILENRGTLRLEENTHFFVGCPSGWTSNQRREYEVILTNIGLTNVKVMPESRAAFLFSKETGELNQNFEDLQDNVLIIDIGSSTTDFTSVKNLEEQPIDSGNIKLGGGLIDQEIFNYILNSYSPEEKSKFEELFKLKPLLKSKCLLKCRQVKESYFSAATDSKFIDEYLQELQMVEDYLFKIRLYKKDMDAILNSPISTLNNKSWKATFMNQLEELKKLEDFSMPKMILMTGGASKMQFTKEITESIFPEIESKNIFVGANPSLSISKGLAVAGKLDFKIKYFKEDADILITSPVLYNIVYENFPSLISKMSDSIAEHFIQIAIEKTIAWRNGEIGGSIKVLKKEISSELNEVLTNNKDLFTKDMKSWLLELNPEVEKLTSNLCKKYDIRQGAFNLASFDYKTGDIFQGVDELNFIDTWEDLLVQIALVVAGIIALFLNIIGGIILLIIAMGVITERDDIPLFIRKMVPEDRVKNKIRAKKGEFKMKVQNMLDEELRNEATIKRVLAPIKAILHESAERASLLIR